MDAMIRLNVVALTRLTYGAAPGFVARGGGTIVNIASSVAISPEALNGVYGGSKAFVLAFSQSLNHELAGKRVRVQAVLPGATATEFWDIAGLPVRNLPTGIVSRRRTRSMPPSPVSTRERWSPFHPCPTRLSGIGSTQRAARCPASSRVLSRPADTTSGVPSEPEHDMTAEATGL